MSAVKKLKTKNIYRSSNFTFDADKISAHSYGHWEFVRVIDGLVVYNGYRYSNSTSKHQSKARCLMQDLKIKIDRTVYTKESLSSWNKQKLESYIEQTELNGSNENLISNFLEKRTLKKLTKSLNEGVDHWGEGYRLYIEYEGFNTVDTIDRDTNGDSLNVQYSKRVEEIQGITLDRDFTSSLAIYMHTRGRRNVAIHLKNQKGKRETIHLAGSSNGNNQQWVYERKEVCERIARFGGLRNYTKERRCRALLEKAFYLIDDSQTLTNRLEDSEGLLCRTMKRLGVEITGSFDFNKRISIRVNFVQSSLDSHRIVIGNWSNNTYNSLPSLITIVKRKSEPKRTKLADIGLEKSGYHDHHNRCQILDEHLDVAKRFGARFKKIESANLKRGAK